MNRCPKDRKMFKSYWYGSVTLFLIFNAFASVDAWAWGKRGHQIVGENAALLAAQEPTGAFLKDHSFDFGYYNNIPDLVWKKPSTYADESNNHFMDMEIFDRAFAAKKVLALDALKLSRADFEKKYPEVDQKAGRAFWRVQEFADELQKVTEQLRQSSKKLEGKDSGPEADAHKKLQERWLVLAGILGHYIADLSQPLHVTENYDGQMTNQKGLHHLFEEEYVNELYPQLAADVLRSAKSKWGKFKKDHASKTILELLMEESADSLKQVPALLTIDKKTGRKKTAKDIQKAAERFRPLILARLTVGSLTLAEIYRRNLDWTYLGNKFYFFGSEPAHISSGPVK